MLNAKSQFSSDGSFQFCALTSAYIIWVIFTTLSTRYQSHSMLDCVCMGQSTLNFLSVSVENLWYFRSFRSTYCARKLSMLQIFRFYLWFNIWDWQSRVRQTVGAGQLNICPLFSLMRFTNILLL